MYVYNKLTFQKICQMITSMSGLSSELLEYGSNYTTSIMQNSIKIDHDGNMMCLLLPH